MRNLWNPSRLHDLEIKSEPGTSSGAASSSVQPVVGATQLGGQAAGEDDDKIAPIDLCLGNVEVDNEAIKLSLEQFEMAELICWKTHVAWTLDQAHAASASRNKM